MKSFKILISCFTVCLMMICFHSPFVFGACLDPVTQEEEVYEDEEGNFYVLSKHVDIGACAGCGDCVVPF